MSIKKLVICLVHILLHLSSSRNNSQPHEKGGRKKRKKKKVPDIHIKNFPHCSISPPLMLQQQLDDRHEVDHLQYAHFSLGLEPTLTMGQS